MKKVVLKPLTHRGTECIGIYFDNHGTINSALRKLAAAKWSHSQKCWYVPLNKVQYNKVLLALQGKAEPDQSALQAYLLAKEKAGISGPATAGTKPVARLKEKPPEGPLVAGKKPAPVQSHRVVYKGGTISAVNAHVLPALKQALILKAYSTSTIRTYTNEVGIFLRTLQQHPADKLTSQRLKDYLQYCAETLKLTENTLHSRMNALKFYYEQVLGREKFFWEIPRPKKPVQLPHFFNQDEVAAIIKATENSKHRTMLMLAYSSGLRVSEVVNIRTSDIDCSRMCILIRQAKGKKDRMVPLSPILLVMLREYWRKQKPSREGYLFAGQNAGTPYSARSLQLVLTAAKKKAGIMKPGSIHALRHSFATHLLDKGTDVTMIMKLLGHNDLKTTLRYLHVTNRDLLGIISPLDSLDLG